jgi:ribosome-associated protein
MALAVRKLQGVIVDALENVKAQDIRVFDTEHLSALFERVIVASGTSNRQTRALASSVRDAVKAAGEPHPRTEGEENGEWIIVDCGPAVVHVMQPAIRTYYHLEELWGEKPVKSKAAAKKAVLIATGGAKALAGTASRKASAADAPAGKAAVKAVAKTAAKAARKTPAKSAPRPAAKSAPRKSASARPAAKRAAPASRSR